MLTANPIPKDISLPTVRRAVQTSVAGRFSTRRLTQQQIPRVKGKQGSVRAVISSGDSKSSSTVEDSKQLVSNNNNNNNGSLSSSSSGIEVKAVITIRKKMKEKMSEKIEDQWESFIIGIGQGILIQLISQDIDPGN